MTLTFEKKFERKKEQESVKLFAIDKKKTKRKEKNETSFTPPTNKIQFSKLKRIRKLKFFSFGQNA
jgi:hypothetical protein